MHENKNAIGQVVGAAVSLIILLVVVGLRVGWFDSKNTRQYPSNAIQTTYTPPTFNYNQSSVGYAHPTYQSSGR